MSPITMRSTGDQNIVLCDSDYESSGEQNQ